MEFKLWYDLRDGKTQSEALLSLRNQRRTVRPESLKYELYQHVLVVEPTRIELDSPFVIFVWVIPTPIEAITK